ncbi:GNAT family N-acetyltransferase [Streptomyces acidiscabies]|uniref:GNAT family N-acetyltransferase n=1 Tax=Streptomyces acidiscabies TaxID=42234 RepID=UPI0030D26207
MTEPAQGEDLTRTPAHALRLRRLNRWQAETLREELADLYVESTRARAGEAYEGREEFARRLAGSVRRLGFSLLVAEDTGLVGCAYGFPVPRQGSWWKGFDGTLPRNVEQLTASGHVFAITEIMVHPHSDGHGVARRLQEQLLDYHHASLGATLIAQTDTLTRDAFLSWGWQDIGGISRPSDPMAIRPTDPVPLRAMVLPTGPDAATRQDGLAHENRTQQPD